MNNSNKSQEMTDSDEEADRHKMGCYHCHPEERVYTGRIQTVFEYGASAWVTTAKSELNKAHKVQNQALQIMTGAMWSTLRNGEHHSPSVTGRPSKYYYSRLRNLRDLKTIP